MKERHETDLSAWTGPIATLLLEAFRAAHPEKRLRRDGFRAVGPLFDTADFDVCGRLTEPGRAEL